MQTRTEIGFGPALVRAVLVLTALWLLTVNLLGCASERNLRAEQLTFDAVSGPYIEYSEQLAKSGEITQAELASRYALRDLWRRDVYPTTDD